MQHSIVLMSNVNRSQISITDTHYNIKSIPITVDDAVMNGVLYSAAENKKGMPSMIGNPVTLGHPSAGESGRSGSGLEDHYSGGTVKNVYNKSKVWYADVNIKKSLLNAQDGGKEYAEMLDNKETIGVSTGLVFEDNQISGTNSEGDDYTKSAVNQEYDHLAMLASEAPAGGSDTVMRFNVADIMPSEHPVDGMMNRFLAQAKAWFVNESENGYNAQEPVSTTNNDGDTIMLNKIKAKLTAANVKTEGLDDDQLLDAYNKMMKDDMKKGMKKDMDNMDYDNMTEDEKMAMKKKKNMDKEKNMSKNEIADLVTSAVNAAVKPLQDQLAAASNAEVSDLTTKMKAMATNRLSDSVIGKMDAQEMKDHLAQNGVVSFNASSGQHTQQNSSDLLDDTCPE